MRGVDSAQTDTTLPRRELRPVKGCCPTTQPSWATCGHLPVAGSCTTVRQVVPSARACIALAPLHYSAESGALTSPPIDVGD